MAYVIDKLKETLGCLHVCGGTDDKEMENTHNILAGSVGEAKGKCPVRDPPHRTVLCTQWETKRICLFQWQLMIFFHGCVSYTLCTSGPWVQRMLLVRSANLWLRVENRAIQPLFHSNMSLSFSLCYHSGILLQNMDILHYNLPLLSYWSWLCLRFGSFPNTISVFTCSSQRGNCMWKHSTRRGYFVAIIYKPCVYMGVLRRIQSISPSCDASTSISNDCSKSLYFLQK